MLISSAPATRARLAETRAQIEARYGKATSQYDSEATPGVSRAWYEHAGVSIKVTYIQNVCYGEDYIWSTAKPPSPGEVRVLLNTNSFGLVWLTLEQRLQAQGVMLGGQPDLTGRPDSPKGWDLCDPNARYDWGVLASWEKARMAPPSR